MLNVPFPLPSKIVRLLDPPLVVTRSKFESALKKPFTTVRGASPTTIGRPAAVKVPSPFPSKMLTLSESWLHTATSCLPSLL